jgi:predicted transcriptional regulator
MSVKEQVLEAIQRLPDDVDYRDVAEEIAFLSAIGEAEKDIEEGRVITHEQMKSRVEIAFREIAR